MKGHWTAYMVISFMTCILMHRIELLPVKDCGIDIIGELAESRS